MDGDCMRRGNNFWRRNQYKIAVACLFAAVLGITGVYLYTGKVDSVPNQQAAVEDTEEAGNTVASKDADEEVEETEQTAKASAVIEPESKDSAAEKTEDAAEQEEQEAQPEENAADTTGTAAKAKANTTELHFDTDAGLMWPVSGSVILDYSMDQTVYFTTLDQYKYNPAVIISGNVNDKVKAAASGKIVDISTNEVTGCTVTMDIGDGYTAIYGQLKEVPYETGAYVEAGNTLGFVNEPTKYYSLEGSNVYFELQKDGAPIDPVTFFQ